MILGRKITVWLISFGVVLAVFLLYMATSDTGMVKVSRENFDFETPDVNMASADANAGRIGQAKLQYLEQARFETIDEKTKKLKRVVGFERVLHKTGDEWELEKPFMNIFQDDLRCDVTADTGTVELENVAGAEPSPKNALLKDNVVIHILPNNGDSSDESFVYLDDVTFDSDRSMFSSDSMVRFESKDAELEGKGLEIIYNSVTSRLEYLKIKRVDFLNIKTLKQISNAAEQTSDAGQSGNTSLASANKSEEKQNEKQSSAVQKKQENYQCVFRDNVVIEYKDEVVLAEEIAISNLLWSSGENKDTENTDTQKQEPGNVAAEKSVKTDVKTITPKQKQIVAVVKCDGPMIVKPISVEKDDFVPAEFKDFSEIDNDLRAWLKRRNVFLAERIDYDYTADIAKANGNVNLVFYPEIKGSRSKENLPAVISAEKGAKFITGKKQALFYGNVIGTLVSETAAYNEKNVFYGEELTVDLQEQQGKEDVFGGTGISHIAIAGPLVRLESVRTSADVKLSHVRLVSKKIDYYKDSADIVAAGRGRIEYSSKKAVSGKNDENVLGLNKPCYALIEGFDKLVWNTNSMHVLAQSEKTKGVHIGYLPIVDGQYGKKITIDTRQIDIDYTESIKGKAKLDKLNAKGGIVYYEEDRYEFVGDKLFFNASQNYMTVAGSDETSCMLNGVFVNGIEYNLESGRAQAVLGRGVGIMPVKE